MTEERKGVRCGTRIAIELPVNMRWKSSTGIERHAIAKTGNISGNGLFIRTSLRLRHDTQVQLTVLFPAEATKVPTQLQCKGRVVRQQGRTSTAGVGLVIDDYELLSVPLSG